MFALFHLFEFAYPGILFFDRSGAVARQLENALPGLRYKAATVDQRDFSLPSKDIDLFYGIAIGQIQSIAPNDHDFPSTAARFLQIITETFEIDRLREFRFRYVLGKPCASAEEAQTLLWQLVPEETKVKLQSVAQPTHWQALQAEYQINNLGWQTRTAVIDLVPHRTITQDTTGSQRLVPHITFHIECRGLASVAVADFDAESFMKNVRDNHAREILSKLAPHLD